MNNKSSGGLGLAALIGVGIVGFLLKSIIPSLGRIFLGTAVVGMVLIALLVGVVIYFAFFQKEEKPAEDSGNAMLSKGRAKLMDIRRTGMRVNAAEIRKLNDETCATADKILQTLKSQPDDLPRMRQLFSYYLPTWASILQKYVRLEESGVMDPRMTESMLLCMKDIKAAMEKMYRNLFEDDILDLTVEMEVLNMVGKRDGLLDEGTLQAGE